MPLKDYEKLIGSLLDDTVDRAAPIAPRAPGRACAGGADAGAGHGRGDVARDMAACQDGQAAGDVAGNGHGPGASALGRGGSAEEMAVAGGRALVCDDQRLCSRLLSDGPAGDAIPADDGEALAGGPDVGGHAAPGEPDASAAPVADATASSCDGPVSRSGRVLEEIARRRSGEPAHAPAPREHGAFELSVMNLDEARNAPDDLEARRHVTGETISGTAAEASLPAASASYRAAEGFVAASSWPAGLACAFAFLVSAACLSSWAAAALAALPLGMSLLGLAVKQARDASFDMTAPTRSRRVMSARRAVVSRGHMKPAVFSLLSGVVFAVVLAFSLISFPAQAVTVAWACAFAATFAVGYAQAGSYASSSAPYGDVYDVEFDDGRAAVIAFDLVDAGDKLDIKQVDGEPGLYVAALRGSTREKIAADGRFELRRGVVVDARGRKSGG